MSETDSIRDSYDRLADEYARRLFNELENKPLDRELLSRFEARTRGRGQVCDMGCGPGHVARYLSDKGADVFGIDLSTQMIEEARRLNPDIQFSEGNMLALDFSAGSLAGIAAFYAIVNIPANSLAAAFREMLRVLVPGGVLLLAFHVGDESLQPEQLWGRPISMGFFHFQTADILRMLEGAGFAIDEVVERGPYAPEVEYQSARAYIFAHRPV